MPATLDVGALRATAGPGGVRASARVGSSEAWFESPDLALEAVPEAFGAADALAPSPGVAFLIPAAATGRALAFSDPVSAIWSSGSEGLLRIAERWWGYSAEPPFGVRRPERLTPRPNRADRTALCFSGGVDSFYSLLRRHGLTDARR